MCGRPVPDVAPYRRGESIAVHEGHLIRVLTYLEGSAMAEVHPRSPDLLLDLGRTMGAVDVALEGFDHPAASRHLYWDVRHAERTIGDRLEYIADPARRELVRETLARYPAALSPATSRLRTAVIHNDANDHNLLVDRGGMLITGLLDFGDMVRTLVANEVAVACAYAMLDEEEPLEAARAVVRGYREAAPLPSPELSVLVDLIRIRLATSVSVAAHQHAQRPDDPYLTVSERQAWALLELLDPIDPETARTLFLEGR